MTDQSMPSLADDEATLAGYANELAEALEAAVEPWLTRLVLERAPQLRDSAPVAAKVATAAREVVHELQVLLALDIADQTTGPLELLRRAVTVPTEILRSSGVPVAPRDDFSVQNFPDDIFDLTPASFSSVDPSLHEPGLIWGAAKAHVHLRRRRQ